MEFVKGVPKLNSTISYNSLKLTPIEGYFLSRIDGVSTVEDIASLSGLPYDQAIEVIESLWGKKVFIIEGAEPAVNKKNGDIDLNEDEQTAIEKMADVAQKGTFYQILSLPVDVKPEQVKVRFFELSKTFHPDRYFRKNIGHYNDMLTMIFKKLSEAYEVLYDPKKKGWYDAMLARPRTDKPKPGFTGTAAINNVSSVSKEAGVQKQQVQTGPQANKINTHTDATEKTVSYKEKNILSDAENTEKTVKMQRTRGPEPGIEQKIAIIEEKFDKNMIDDALKEIDELKGNIKDPRIPLLMANYYLKQNNLLSAKDYAQQAIEYDENNIEAYEMLGDIYMKFKLYRNALKVYETVMRIDPVNAAASRKVSEIKSLIED